MFNVHMLLKDMNTV